MMAIEEHPDAGRDAVVFEVRNVSKRYGAVRALHDVSLVLSPGEVVGLVGDNGAGKSTLVGVMSGAIRPDHGEILVNGRAEVFHSPSDARRAGIETVFQFLSLIPTLDIAENVFLRREAFGPGAVKRRIRWMDKSGMRRRVEEGFSDLGLSLPDTRTKVAALSGGQRQAVAIARAILWGSHIVMMDEPTAALGIRQTEIVLSFVERLKSHGIGVIFISHNLQHVLRVATRVVALRLGEKVLDQPVSSTSHEELLAAMTGLRDFRELVTGRA